MNQSKISKGISLGVRIAALLLLVLFFVPSITVSCQGVAPTDVSGFDAAIGTVEVAEENVEEIDAAPWLFLIPALAIAVGILACKLHFVTMACSLANIGMIFVFKATVKGWVNDNLAEYASYVIIETKEPFTFHIVLCVLIILAVAFDKFILCHEGNRVRLEGLFKKNTATGSAKAVFCHACGQQLAPTAKFCAGCGAAVQAPVADETAGAKSDEEAESDPTPAEETDTSEIVN